jgi:hypothetical protein
MNPVLGNAATSAPKAASFMPTRGFSDTAIVKKTISKPAARYTPIMTGLSRSKIGVLAPKRNSRQGSAKYNTKVLRPGIALSGSTWRRAAR